MYNVLLIYYLAMFLDYHRRITLCSLPEKYVFNSAIKESVQLKLECARE